jgi:STAM-binding protein
MLPPTRPATIAELATLAQSDPDAAPSSAHDLKHYLRRAETHRRTGQTLASGAGGGPTASNRGGTADAGTDLERAFVEYARAATLIVEKIPEHAGYASGLTVEQRANLKAVS